MGGWAATADGSARQAKNALATRPLSTTSASIKAPGTGVDGPRSSPQCLGIELTAAARAAARRINSVDAQGGVRRPAHLERRLRRGADPGGHVSGCQRREELVR